MIKIQTQELDGQVILRVEGRLIGPLVAELEKSWQAAREYEPRRKIVIDLKNVICVDREGRSLLRSMYSSGVAFVRAGLATQDILEQIMEQPECTHRS